MPRIVVGVPSLYPKLEVAIGEKVYLIRPLNQALWDSLAKLEMASKDKNLAESMSVLYEQVVTMTGAPKKAVEALDIRDIQRIINFVTDAVRKGPELEEKKELRPEEKN